MDAQKIIGKQDKNDWIINPKEHAASLPKEAETLKKILRSSKVEMLRQCFDQHNSQAIESQKLYLKQSKRRIIGSTLSVIVGAVILYVQSTDGILIDFSQYKDIIINTLGVIELGLLAMTTYYVTILKNSNMYEDWMDERSNAENVRIQYFKEITKSGDKNDIDLAKLQLEYFYHYMLCVQLNYYEGRGEQHKKNANKFTTRTGMLTMIAAVVTAVPATINVAKSSTDIVALLAFISAVVAALTSMQSQLSALNEDQRNARRYQVVYYKLFRLTSELDTVRNTIEQGDRTALETFVKKTNKILAQENQEWQTRKKRKSEFATYQTTST